MAFDVEGAIRAGYSETDIATFLSKENDFDLPKALESGYTSGEVIQFLSDMDSDDTTFLGSVGEFGKRALGGVATGAVSTVTGLGQLIPGLDDESLIETDQSFREGVAETLGYDSAYDENYGAQLGQVVGEMVPMVASAFLPGGPLALAARVGAVTGPALSEGSFDRAEFESRTGEKLSDYERLTSKGADIALGQLERFGIPARIMKGLPKGFFATNNVIGQRIQSMIAGGLREGVQEVGQGIARDISTLAIYDPDRKIADSALDDFTLGGGAGAIFDLAIGLAQTPLKGRKNKAPKPLGEMTEEEVEREKELRSDFEQRQAGSLAQGDQKTAKIEAEQPDGRVVADPFDTTLLDSTLPADRMAQEIILRSEALEDYAPYLEEGALEAEEIAQGIPAKEAFATRERDGMFYVEQGGIQYGPLMQDPVKANDVMVRLNEYAGNLRKQANVEYAVDQVQYPEVSTRETRIPYEGFVGPRTERGSETNIPAPYDSDVYVEGEAQQPLRESVIEFGNAIPSPDERIISVEEAEAAVPGISTKVNKLRDKEGKSPITVDGPLNQFTLNELRRANRGDIGALGDILLAKEADALAFERGEQPPAATQPPINPMRPNQPALGRQRGIQQFNRSFDSEINSEYAFRQLLDNKMIDGGTDSQAFRGLIKRILGKAPSKESPLDSLTPSERRYLYHRIRQLPSFRSAGQAAPVTLPDFSVKPPQAELVQKVRQAVRAGESPQQAVEKEQLRRTGSLPSAAEQQRATSQGQRTAEPVQRGGEPIAEDQQVVPFNIDESALGQQLRDMLSSYGVDDVWATKMVEKVGSSIRDSQGNIYITPVEDTDGNTTTEGQANRITQVIQVGLDGVMRDVENGVSYEEAVAKIMNHEIVHALRSMDLFTAAEWSLLERLTRTYKKEKENVTYGQWASSLYSDQSAVLIQEEAIAEMLSDALTGRVIIGNKVGKPSGKPASLIKRLVNFFKKLVGFAENNDVQSFSDLVNKLQSGEVGGRERGVVRTPFRTEAKDGTTRIAREDLLAETGQRGIMSQEQAERATRVQRDARPTNQTLSDAPIVGDIDEEAVESRRARAEEQGFDTSTVYYHGTGTRNRAVYKPGDGPTGRYEEFSTDGIADYESLSDVERKAILQDPPIKKFERRRRAEDHLQLPLAFGVVAGHFSDSSKFVERFAKIDKLGTKNADPNRPSPTIYPMYLRFGDDNSNNPVRPGLFSFYEADRDGALQAIQNVADAPLKAQPGLLKDLTDYYRMEVDQVLKNPRASIKAIGMGGSALLGQVREGELSPDAAARQLAEIYHTKQMPVTMETLTEEPEAVSFAELEMIAPYIKEAGFAGYRDIEVEGGKYTGIAMFNPADIKGVYAQYDPSAVPEGAAYDDDIMYSRRGVGKPLTKALERASQKYSDVRIASEEEFFRVFWNNLIQEVGGTVAPNKLRVAGKRAVNDIKKWIKENPKYNDYYKEDLKAMRMALEAEYGKLPDEEVLLYQFLLGATSPQTELQVNVEESLRLFDLYRRNGNFDSFRMGKSDKGNAIVADGPLVFVGSSGPNKARAIKSLDKVVRSQGGLKQALNYMLQPVPMKELESFKKSLGYAGVSKKGEIKGLVKEATGQDELIPRVFFMGPKLGSYTINLMGDTRFQTVDVWEARFIRSYFDNMYDVNTGITANADEATLFRDFGRVFAEEFEKIVGYKTDAATLQAMRWFYMINAAKQAGYTGANTNETISELTQRKIEETGGRRYGGRTASAVENTQGADGVLDSRRGSADSPEYGRTVQGGLRPDGRLALTHYSNKVIARTDPQKAGSGADIRKPNRPTIGTWFGVTEAEENPYVREPVVGAVPNKFAIEPSRLYVIADYKNPDVEQDPLGVWTQDPRGRVDYDAILEKVSAAGFDGFLINAPALGKVALVTKPLEAVDDAMASRRVSGDRLERTRDRAGRLQAGRLEALEGAPVISGATGPDPYLNAAAEAYAEEFGIPIQRQPSYVEINERFAKQLADAYEAMEHNPSDPAVAEAYQDLAKQVKDQYNFLVDSGYSFTFFDSETDPYDGNPWNAMRDLRNNRTMAVYGTYDGYGTDGITAKDVEENPMLAATGLFWSDQKGQAQPVTINDLFRAVHDALGHGLEGAGFRARGEENAWQAHSRLFTGPALAALTTETRGQNSWLNFGPHGKSNQTAALEDTVFADQKIGLLPSWAWAKSPASASKNVDTETLSKRSVASQSQVEDAVRENVNQVDTTQGPPRFSLKASPEAQYVAQNPSAGITDADFEIPENRQPLSAGQSSTIDRLTTNEYPENANGKVFMESVNVGPIGEMLTRFKAMAINRYAALEKYYQRVPGLRELEADSSAIAAALFADRAKGILASAVKYGVPVYENGLTKVVEFYHNGKQYNGLIDVMSIVYNKEDGDLRKLAQSYAMVKRSVVLRRQGKQTPVTEADAREIEAAVDAYTRADGTNPIREWHDVWTAYNDKTINFLKATGILNEETADQWKDSAYVPFYRGAEAGGEKLPKVVSGVFGNMTRKSEFKKYVGSDKGVDIGLVESATLNLSAAIEMGMRNVAQQRITRDMQAMGLATQIRPNAKGTNAITFKVDGETVRFEIADNLIYDSMETLGGGVATEILQTYLGKPSNFLREMITRDPGFMIANLMRDTLSTFTTSGANFVPGVDSVVGLFDGIERLEKTGVVGGYDFSIDQANILDFYGKENKRRGLGPDGGRGSPTGMFTSIWDALGRATTASDAATRNAVYNDVLARTGNEAEAAFQAMEIINFSRRGAHPLARVLTAAIPFLNARFQGLDVFVRSLSGNYTTNKQDSSGAITAKFLTRGALLAGLTGLYWAMVSGEDWYEEQSEEVRDNNWLIPTTAGVPLRVPIPFEVGLLFKVVPETVLATTLGDKSAREAYLTAKRGIVSTLEINPLGAQAFAPLVEAGMNHNFFTQRPIVPYYIDTKIEGGLQDSQGSTEMAKFVGKALNISPFKIDHVMSGYTGTLGGYVIALADRALKSETIKGEGAVLPPSKNMFEFPLWRRFFASKEGSGLKQDAYEIYNEVSMAVNTLNKLKRENREDEALAFLASRQHILQLKPTVYRIKKYLDDARAYKRDVIGSDLDPDVKRTMIDDLDAQINEYLKIMPAIKEAANIPAVKALSSLSLLAN